MSRPRRSCNDGCDRCERTVNGTLPSSSFLLPPSFFLLPSSFFLLFPLPPSPFPLSASEPYMVHPRGGHVRPDPFAGELAFAEHALDRFTYTFQPVALRSD